MDAKRNKSFSFIIIIIIKKKRHHELSISHGLGHVPSSIHSSQIVLTILLLYQLRRQRLRRVKLLAQNHMSSKW